MHFLLQTVESHTAVSYWEHPGSIDLLITDLMMTGSIDGRELADHLLLKSPNLKVVFMSGYSVEIAGKDFPLQEGGNFLNKPFPADKLARIVRARLDCEKSN